MAKNQKKYEKIKSAGIKLAVVFFWIFVWEIISRIVGIEFLVPSVPKVFSTLARLVTTLIFWEIAFTSIYRILVGFVLGSILGCILAIITAKSKIIYEFFIPVLSIIKATPIVSFIILALVWIKGGNIPSFISFLMVLPIVWGNVYKGIEQTDFKLLEMAKIYKIPSRIVFKDIYFHSVLPYFGAAATTSMGLAWKAGIAAEVIATPRFSIGTAIYDSKIYLETPELFAWSIVVIVLSVILEKGVSRLLKKFVPNKAISKSLTEEASSEKNSFEETSVDAFQVEFEQTNSEKSFNNLDTEYIKLNNISAEYDGVEVLKNFSARFPRNGCVCLFGPSGSGKTTLLNVISGIKEPSQGNVLFNNNPYVLFSNNPNILLKNNPNLLFKSNTHNSTSDKISYVFQEDRLIPWISALSNVEIVQGRKNQSSSAKPAKEILETLGLNTAFGKLPNELSGGMKQRVNIARAIAFDAPVILLDEPFKGLDYKIKQEIIEIFLNLKKDKLLILITHDKKDVKSLADSVIHFS